MRRSPFKSGYALLHLLILRSVTPSSQEKPRYVSSDLAPPVQLYSYLFCTFVTTRLRSGPCIIDVWCWCEPHLSHLLSLSRKFSFFYRFWFTDSTSTDCLPCSGCFPFQQFLFLFFFLYHGWTCWSSGVWRVTSNLRRQEVDLSELTLNPEVKSVNMIGW